MTDLGLRTERLVIRPWAPDEAATLLEIRSLPEVARWLDPPEPWTDLRQAHEAIARFQARLDEGGPLGEWAVVPHDLGYPVGTVSIHEMPEQGLVATGWYLHPDAFGKGYAAEAAKVVVDAGLAAGLTEIWAIMYPENEASARVATKIGMTDLGVREDPWYGSPDAPVSRMFCAYATESTLCSDPSVTS